MASNDSTGLGSRTNSGGYVRFVVVVVVTVLVSTHSDTSNCSRRVVEFVDADDDPGAAANDGSSPKLTDTVCDERGRQFSMSVEWRGAHAGERKKRYELELL